MQSFFTRLLCLRKFLGGIPKRPTGTDCKSVDLCLRRFESFSPHVFLKKISSGCSSVGRATAFQAVGRRFEPGHPLRLIVSKFEFLELIVLILGLSPLQAISRRSSGAERFLGKEKVMGSTPIVGSTLILM